jgi:hypothetical protein
MPLACLEGHIPHVCAVGREIVEKCLGDYALNDTPRKFDGLRLAYIDPDSRAIGLFTQA